jgi:hypothetical protein
VARHDRDKYFKFMIIIATPLQISSPIVMLKSDAADAVHSSGSADTRNQLLEDATRQCWLSSMPVSLKSTVCTYTTQPTSKHNRMLQPRC